MRGTGGDHLEGIKSDSPPVRRHRLADRRGQSLVEFALVLPILLLIVVGILEFGLAFRTYQVITNAAREGARVAVIGESPGVVRAAVDRYLGSAGLDTASAVMEFECNPDPNSAFDPDVVRECETGEIASVTITYPVNFVILGVLLDRIVGPPELTSVSQMRTE